jgi:phage pi2 protein 07
LPFTLITDVTAGYVGDIPPDEVILDKIEEVELIITRRLGDLTVWADTDVRARALRTVVKRAVRRVLSNPMGARSVTEGMGPFSHSYTLDPRASSGTLWVTTDDWLLLGVGQRKPGTIKVGSAARAGTRGPAGPDYFWGQW